MGVRMLVQEPSSFVIFIASHIVNPSFYAFFPTGERGGNSNHRPKRIPFRVGRTDDRAILFNDEFDTVASSEAEALANLLRNGHLTFAADGTEVGHLYLASLP
jgi:hypothetical protein